MTTAQQADFLWKNFEALDAEAMISELLLNHIEDMIIGRKEALESKAFGTGDSWSNYYRKIGDSKGNETRNKDVAQLVNRELDKFAGMMGLKRVQCGRS